MNASFVYDGDGQRARSTINGVATTFVDSYYEQTGGTITKYYYAGAQRVAMRVNGTLSFLLTDHLGLTSLTTDASGNLISELRYTAWGEVRFTEGVVPTKYSFTGQYSDSYINLLWYGSRHYDPALGRFIQPDSIVPLASQGVQAYDRYAHVNNNPVRYTDPTGHCIACIVQFGLSAFGFRPDIEGVLIASVVTMNQKSDILVTAGIAVQTEYPWALVGDTQRWAQATSEELEGRNPFSPSVSVEIMEERFDKAVDYCKFCNDGNNDGIDKLIVIALAQNGFDFSPKGVGDAMSQDGIDWEQFLDTNGENPSAWYAQMRQNVTQQNYDTQFMLKLFIKDLRLLMSMGHDLPDWLTEKDIKYIEDNYLRNKDK